MMAITTSNSIRVKARRIEPGRGEGTGMGASEDE